MAYIKIIPIRVTEKKAINYAMNTKKTIVLKDNKEKKNDDIKNVINYTTNENKTTFIDELDKDIRTALDENMKNNGEEIILSSGINCAADVNLAYIQFNLVYKKYPHKISMKGEKKTSIKAHHLVQSFKKGEVDPIKAHEIGKQLCEKTIGGNFQVIVSTHVDKEHIHNHIVFNAVGLDGKKYNSNKETLREVRSIGDTLCKEHNLSVIKPQSKNKNYSYKEWKERKNGTSWKQKIEIDIDELIVKVNSLEELLSKLKDKGYEIKIGKYIAVRPKEKERFVRTKTLGENYTEEALRKRIEEKELQNPTKKQIYSGIQVPYVQTIKDLGERIATDQFKVYRRFNRQKPYSVNNDYYVHQLANQLRYLTTNKINSEDALLSQYEEVRGLYEGTTGELKELNKSGNMIKDVITNIDLINELKDKPNKTNAEIIKYTSAKQLLLKFKINTQKDMEKIKSTYQNINTNISHLNGQMQDVDERFKMVQSICETYKDIKENRYVYNIMQKERSKYNLNFKEHKNNKER